MRPDEVVALVLALGRLLVVGLLAVVGRLLVVGLLLVVGRTALVVGLLVAPPVLGLTLLLPLLVLPDTPALELLGVVFCGAR